MGVVINELSIEVTGLIVKNNNDAGNSVLRMSQEQAYEIYRDLDKHFSKNGAAPEHYKDHYLTVTPENIEPKTKTG